MANYIIVEGFTIDIDWIHLIHPIRIVNGTIFIIDEINNVIVEGGVLQNQPVGCNLLIEFVNREKHVVSIDWHPGVKVPGISPIDMVEKLRNELEKASNYLQSVSDYITKNRKDKLKTFKY